MPEGIRAQPGEPAATFKRLIAIETNDCIVWPHGTTPGGYGEFRLDGKTVAVHVLACETANGSNPGGCEVAHSCGVRCCMNPRHLRWATRSSNQMDRLQHGTHNRGERCGSAILTEDTVREIRQIYAEGSTLQRELGARFGVSQAAISVIVRRERWSWLD